MPSDYQRIERAIHWLLEHQDQQPALDDLAEYLGLSRFHTQRLFSRWAGISPKQFLQYLTVGFAKQLLNESKSVLESALDSGLSGPGRLHDQMISIDAITPGEYKSGGRGLQLLYGMHETPFGQALIGTTERGICHLSFLNPTLNNPLDTIESEWPNADFKQDQNTTGQLVQQIFDTQNQLKEPLHLLLRGTNFQVKVWEALLTIPSGSLLTYENIAQLIGQPKAARAMGNAIGKNAIAFLIPCHRVIRNSGIIGRYRWGSERKRAILTWEAGHQHHNP